MLQLLLELYADEELDVCSGTVQRMQIWDTGTRFSEEEQRRLYQSAK